MVGHGGTVTSVVSLGKDHSRRLTISGASMESY